MACHEMAPGMIQIDNILGIFTQNAEMNEQSSADSLSGKVVHKLIVMRIHSYHYAISSQILMYGGTDHSTGSGHIQVDSSLPTFLLA